MRRSAVDPGAEKIQRLNSMLAAAVQYEPVIDNFFIFIFIQSFSIILLIVTLPAD